MVKHNGGKADVHAIGDRNVGCKTGLGNWYGVEKQVSKSPSGNNTPGSSKRPVITE